MAIEFLYSKEDVPSFVENLYSQHYYLAREVKPRQDLILTQVDATAMLITDLFFPGSRRYWIGDSAHSHILQMDSCGKQSHPAYVGKQGRIAGLLSLYFQPEHKESAQDIHKIVKTYLRKHGTYRNYNPGVRMSCYFLPSYAQLDDAYRNEPHPSHICPGGLQILCLKDQTEVFLDKVHSLSDFHPSIQCKAQYVSDYGEDHSSANICLDFLCDRSCFAFGDFQKMIRWISGNQKAVVHNQKLRMIAESAPDRSMIIHPMDIKIKVYIDNPWQCWVGQEETYSGKPVILWPDK
jgi:hypothetical protein